MKITDLKCYPIKSPDSGARAATVCESEYRDGDGHALTFSSNPMSIHPKYSRRPGFGVELKRELLAPYNH